MVIAHHKLIRGELIERFLQLLGLAHGKVAGVRHLVVLALQQPLPAALVKNAND